MASEHEDPMAEQEDEFEFAATALPTKKLSFSGCGSEPPVPPAAAVAAAPAEKVRVFLRLRPNAVKAGAEADSSDAEPPLDTLQIVDEHTVEAKAPVGSQSLKPVNCLAEPFYRSYAADAGSETRGDWLPRRSSLFD